nr:neurogenic locus notch homolog protein 3-like [Lytechinus pictus]
MHLCIAGYYCPTEGLSWPVECPQGFFCPAGSQYPSACPTGTYGNSTLLRRSEDCTPCPGGYYCEGAGNLEPTDVCDAGFFCAFKAVSSAPVDGFTGGVCPPGGYCPAGTAYPANCPLGTYSNSSGSKSADDCIACDPGYYCAGDNNPEPTGPCEPGYFCTGGSGTSIQHEVPEGHYSGSAAYKAEPCERGSYQTARKSSYCLDCPQGAYCNESGTATPAPCLSGHYCPPRTIIPVPCPTGTHRVETSAQEVGDCTTCPPGKFCGETGLIDVSGDCAAGHYCIGGADTSHPYETDCANATILGGGECPAGYYCPEGTETPTSYPCQNGTYLNVTGGKEIEDCLDCPGGEVCGGYALTEPNELCAPGYFCAGKAKTKYPTDGETGNICPVGHYCPEGSPAAMRCPDGEYNNITGKAECFTCPQGFYCADGERLLACPRGHYCPEGTGSNGSIPCPRGTYNPDLGLASVDQCQPCAPGYYCTQLGAYTFGIANASAGPCDQGYFCQSGVNISNPDGETNSGIGGPCPKGFFCPQQTSVPQPCPNGTYSDSLYLYEEAQCEACDPGFYCGTYNLTAPQAPCDPGFYCHYGSSYPNPIGDDITGAPCPVGTYCEEGSSEPIGCPAGTYNEITQQSECQPCPAGWYCPGNVSNFRPYDCPAGYYCPNGTEHAYQYPCPKGTYRPNENGQTLSDCTICDPGKYCAYEGNTTVTGDCDEGYFCIQGAWTDQPMDFDNYTDGDCLCPSLSTGGRCQPGYYCPRGSFEPEECTEGNYCDVEGTYSSFCLR